MSPESSARLRVYVTPKAGEDRVVGWRAGELAIKVGVAPERGKANARACEVVARAVGIPKSAVTVEKGGSSRHKTLVLRGVGTPELERAFGPLT